MTTDFNPIEQQLYNTRSVFISGPVESTLALKVNQQLLALEASDDKRPIILWINSPGGEVYSGFSIYDTVQFIRPRVITVVAGMAASMGSVIALSAEKADRLALPHSRLLIHQPLISGTLQGPASDLEIHAKDIIDLKQRIHQLYADRTGTPVEHFQKLMERDRWVDTEEAINLGLINRVLSTRQELEDLLV